MILLTHRLFWCKAAIFLLFLGVSKVVHAEFPLEIIGPDLRLGPSIHSSSAVTYKDKIYTYGGATATTQYSDGLYVYEFFEGNGSITLRKEEYTGPSPRCSHCNPVLIPNTSKMLILGYNMDELSPGPQNLTTVPHVLPYIYDFETRTWSIETPSPRLNNGNQSLDVFGMRVGHTVTMARNGLVYVIGGRSYYKLNATKCLTSVWYYNRIDFSYNALVEESPRCFIDSNAFTTLYDDKIRLLFGGTDNSTETSQSTNGTRSYERLVDPSYFVNTSLEFSIDTTTNNWDYRFTTGNPPYYRRAATLQYHPKTDLAYLTGGLFMLPSQQRFAYMQTFTLNVTSGVWMQHNYTVRDFALDNIQRYFASSAIVKDKYYALLYGQYFQGINMYDTRNVDVFRLPNTDEADFDRSKFTISWLDTLAEKTEQTRLDTKYIIIIVVLVCFLALVVALAVLIHLAVKRKSMFSREILSILWFKRNGEQNWVEHSRFVTKIIFLGLFAAFVAYSIQSVIDSPISFTTSYEPLNVIPLPDVRICLSGWDDLYKKPDPPYYFPEIECRVLGGVTRATAPAECKKSISSLDNVIHEPYYVDQQGPLQCFLFRSSEQFDSNGRGVSIIFRLSGTVRQYNEAIYIQLYDRDQNPNRYVFFNESLPEGYSNSDIQKWVANDNNIQQAENSYALYAESSTSIKYQMTENHNLVSDSSWNYVGSISPKYKVSRKLSSTFSLPAPRNTFDVGNISHTLSDIQISPMTSTLIVNTYKRDNTLLGMLGAVGGIISLLAIIQSILFGTRPVKPWGIVHKIRKRQQLETLADALDTERYYYSQDHKGKKSDGISNAYATSIPFSEPVDPRFTGFFNRSKRFGDGQALSEITTDQSPLLPSMGTLEDRVMRLESRNQILELALRSYYIDEEIFQSVKEARSKTEEGAVSEQGIFEKVFDKDSAHNSSDKIHHN